MDNDRKENRRNNFQQKKNKKNQKNFYVDKEDQHKIKNAFKFKKKELLEEEEWEQWEDEIY